MIWTCTVPFFVHELVLSNWSSAVLMTDFADSDVRRNKLVSCFSNFILLPCGIWILSISTVSLSEKNRVGLIVTTRLRPCTARLLTIVLFRSSQYSILCLSVERLSASMHFSLSQFWVFLSKHDPIVLLRRIHDNLYVVRFSWGVWRCLRIRNPFWLTLLLGSIPKLVDWNQLI